MMIPFFALSMAFAADNSCFMSASQQRAVILNEGPKALQAQVTSDCFQRLLNDEVEMHKNRRDVLATDRQGIIEEMLQSAQREEDAKTEGVE